MSRQLSNNLVAQLLSQNSDTPFLTLLTLSHDSFSTIRLVNNTEDIVSRGETFQAFPFKIVLPVDDGESQREVKLVLDNVGLELIDELRTVTDPISVEVELILSSDPNLVEIGLNELELQKVSFSAQQISGTLVLDDFLNTGMTGEQYTPTNFPGIFG